MTTTLTDILSSGLAQRIGWALVHFLWQGLAVAVLLGVVFRVLRRRGPQARYVAACCALAVLAALPIVTAMLITPARPAAPIAPVATESAVKTEPVAAAPLLPLAQADDPAPEHTNVQLPPEPAHFLSADAPPQPMAVGPVERKATPPPAAVPLIDKLVAFIQPALPWAVLAWLVGVAGLSIWHTSSWLLLRRIRGMATPVTTAAVAEAFGRLLHRMAVTRPVRLLESVLVKTPIVIGWLRPVVLMPMSVLSGLSPAQIEAILAHELAHIRRWDCLVRMIQAGIETLLFFHPAVWWVSARVRQESEQCCDDHAVGVCGDRRGYARALATVAGACAPAHAAAATGGKLLPRIRRILGIAGTEDSGHAWRNWPAAIILLMVILLGGLVLTQAENKPSPSSQPATSASQPAVDQAEIDRLIKQLGGDKSAEREAAQKALVEIGAPAVAALKKAALDTDPERAERASMALEAIEAEGSDVRVPLGPVIELTVGDIQGRKGCLLDLDKGELLSLPDSLNLDDRKAIWEYLGDSDADFMAEVDRVGGLAIIPRRKSVASTLRVSKDLWGRNFLPRRALDGLAFAQLGRPNMTLKGTIATQPSDVPVGQDLRLPATYIFDTEQGAIGLLQVMSLPENPKGVKVRYRLITGNNGKASTSQPATAASRPATKPAVDGGQFKDALISLSMDLESGKFVTASPVVFTVTDATQLEALAGFFPELGQGKKSRRAGAWEAGAQINFGKPDGGHIGITVSGNDNLKTWSEGNGDWPVKGDLTAFLLKIQKQQNTAEGKAQAEVDRRIKQLASDILADSKVRLELPDASVLDVKVLKQVGYPESALKNARLIRAIAEDMVRWDVDANRPTGVPDPLRSELSKMYVLCDDKDEDKLPFDKIEAMAAELVNTYKTPAERGIIYAAVAETYGNHGVKPLSIGIDATRRALDCPLEPRTKLMMYMRWGDAAYMQKDRELRGGSESVRREIALPYLLGLREAMRYSLPDAAPELPGVNVGDGISGDKAVTHRLQVQARVAAEFARTMAHSRDILAGQLINLGIPCPAAWAKDPEKLKDMRRLLGNPDTVDQLLSAVRESKDLQAEVNKLLARTATQPTPSTSSGPSTQPAATETDTVARMLATRPAPKLADLAERSRPDVKGPDASETFWDILKLRETGDPKAVPVLAEILDSNAGVGRIHGYAAAQALFCIGGKEAIAALDKHLLQLSDYNEELGSMYVYHWEMPEPKRSQFIQQYLLMSIGKGLDLTPDVKVLDDGKIQFSLTIKNVSAKPLDIVVPRTPNLYLRGKDGRFLPRQEWRFEEYHRNIKWIHLDPGAAQGVTEVAVIKQADEIRKDYPRLPKDVQAVLQVGGMQHCIDKPGECEAVFVFEQLPMSPAAKEKSNLENPWSGRAVSKPIPVRLAIPATQPDAEPAPSTASTNSGEAASSQAQAALAAEIDRLMQLVAAEEGRLDELQDLVAQGKATQEELRRQELKVRQLLATLTELSKPAPTRPASGPATRPAVGGDGWGESNDGLRCRWIVPAKPATIGTFPELAVEVQNVTDQNIEWDCPNELTLSTWYVAVGSSLRAGGTDATYPRFTVGPADVVRIWKGVLPKPVGAKATVYLIPAGGTVTLTGTWPYEIKKAGRYHVETSISRKRMSPSRLELLAKPTTFTCPPMVLSVADATGRVPDEDPTDWPPGPWGQAVDGMQVRLYADESFHNPDAWAAHLSVDIRNFGKSSMSLLSKAEVLAASVGMPANEAVEVEVDGVWYHGDKTVGGTKTVPLAPGNRYRDIEVQPDNSWVDKDGKRLNLGTDKHTFRVAITVQPADGKGRPVRLVSNSTVLRSAPELPKYGAASAPSPTTTSGPASRPTSGPATRPAAEVKALYNIVAANLEQTDFCLGYEGAGVDSDEWTKHSLLLHTTGKEAPPASYVQTKITKEQARRILDHLATTGYLERATDYTKMRLEPMPKNRPGYMLFVYVRDNEGNKLLLLEDLSQGADVANVMRGLRAVLEGKAADAADKILLEMGVESTTKPATSRPASGPGTQPAPMSEKVSPISDQRRQLIQNAQDDLAKEQKKLDQARKRFAPGQGGQDELLRQEKSVADAMARLAELQAETTTQATSSATSRPSTQPTADQAVIDRLIKQLGSEKSADREAAQKALVEIGLPAAAALVEAAKDKDSERAARAKETLRTIRKSSSRISVFLVADPQEINSKHTVADLHLADDPLVVESDIVSYDAKQRVLELADEAQQRVSLLRAKYPGLGCPFVVVVDGRRWYEGAFWTKVTEIAASVAPKKPVTFIDGTGPGGKGVRISTPEVTEQTDSVIRKMLEILTSQPAASQPAAEPDSGPSTQPADKAEIERMIKQLGSDDTTQREQAKLGLISIGEPALPALKPAANGEVPKVPQQAVIEIISEIMKDRVVQQFEYLCGRITGMKAADSRVSVELGVLVDGKGMVTLLDVQGPEAQVEAAGQKLKDLVPIIQKRYHDRYQLPQPPTVSLWIGDKYGAASASRPATQPGTQPAELAKVAKDYSKKISGMLSKGWTVEAKDNRVTIRRDEKVEVVWTPPSSPANANPRHDVVVFEVHLDFGPPVTAPQLQAMQKTNKAREALLAELRRELNYLPHKGDDWIPQTDQDKALIAEFRKAQRDNPYHRIPDGFGNGFSVTVSDGYSAPFVIDPRAGRMEGGGLGHWWGIQPQAVNDECVKVVKLLQGMFSSDPATRPTTAPASGPATHPAKDAATTDWSASEEGVQIGVRADRAAWRADEAPALRWDVRYLKDFLIPSLPLGG